MVRNYLTIALGLTFLGVIISPAVGQAKTWEDTTLGDGFTDGVNEADNTASTLFKLDGTLYAVADNTNGTVLASYSKSDEGWNQITSADDWGFLDDTANTVVTAKLQFKKKVYLAFENSDTGGQIWRVNAQGVTRMNTNAIGTVLHLVDFQDRVLAYTTSDDGNVNVYGEPTDDSTEWELMATLDGDFAQGLDSATVFDDTIYLANRYPAEIYTSIDGYTYTYKTTFDDEFDYQQVSALQVIDNLLIAVGTANRFCYDAQQEVHYTNDGETWTLDESRPTKAFCYTQVVPKKDSDVVYYLGFDSADAVAYKNNGSSWAKQTAENFIADDEDSFESTENREFSDGIWYQGDIYLATENDTAGTQIWSKQ